MAAWRHLAEFASELTLTDLIWSSTDQIPPSVLSALHALKPRCRLHIQNFKLPSLIYSTNHPLPFDDHERAIATSLCLHSVTLYGTRWTSHGKVNYNFDAVMQTASGYAPNLRQICVAPRMAKSSPMLRRASIAGRPPWRGFECPESPPSSHLQSSARGKLRTLQFGHVSGTYWQEIQSWATYIDFSALEELHLPLARDQLETWQKLTHMALAGGLGALRESNVICHEWPQLNVQEEKRTDKAIAAFLTALPPLEKLVLRGTINESTIDAANKRHGENVVSYH